MPPAQHGLGLVGFFGIHQEPRPATGADQGLNAEAWPEH